MNLGEFVQNPDLPGEWTQEDRRELRKVLENKTFLKAMHRAFDRTRDLANQALSLDFASPQVAVAGSYLKGEAAGINHVIDQLEELSRKEEEDGPGTAE